MAPRAIPRDEMLARIASAPRVPPGREWGYSNSAFYLAGVLVEKVSGKSYWEFLDEAFFRPLGMRRARPCAEVPPPARARGYRVENGSLVGAETENWSNPFAGGGLCMTSRELLAWEAALDSGRVLSAESVRAMRTPTRLADGRRYDYGLGTRMGTFEGHPVVGHTGGGQGFSTVLMRFPDDDLTVVVLKNYAAGPGASTIAARLDPAPPRSAGVRAARRSSAGKASSRRSPATGSATTGRSGSPRGKASSRSSFREAQRRSRARGWAERRSRPARRRRPASKS